MVCDLDDPDRLAFPLRRGLVWRRRVSELRTEGAGQDLLPGIASLFNGALFRASTVEAVGVPDLRLFVRGDEVELHRRLVRSGLPFGTCLDAVYLHPQGGDEFKPILGGRMHTQYPDNATKRYFTYRNRGYLLSQPGLRKLLPQEWLRFGWYFLVSRRDPAGLAEWVRLRRHGQAREVRDSHDVHRRRRAVQDDDRAWRDLVDGLRRRELWLHLGWQDIKQRYRRSVLGPFWITIATGVTAVAMGGLYSKLFKLELSEHLPYVTLGLIIWNLINAAILEGADVFVANEGLIKQLPTPLSRARLPAGVAADDPVRAQHRHLRGHRDHLPQAVVVGRPRGHPGAVPDRAQLRVGVTVLRHPVHPLPRHQPAAVQPRAAAVLHDADHLERVDAAAAGRRAVGQDRRAQPAAALPRHRAGAAARAPIRSCGTGWWCWC